MASARPALSRLALGAPSPRSLAALALALTLAAAGCASSGGAARSGDAADAAPIDQLWVEPKNLESRDLFWGPGGRENAPDPNAAYRFLALDSTGHSRGYEVEGPDGRRWKVKVGDEASAELVVSRVLWAIGYHQPSTYYLSSWKLTNGPKHTPEPGRFRLESDHDKKGTWGWKRNPFVGTRELHGFLVANLVLANWDLTKDNNRVYKPLDGRGGPKRKYVAQDVGASLGKWSFPLGSRNRIEDVERQDLLDGVEEGRPVFAYSSYHKGLLKDVTSEDVVWVCRLLARITERQWHDVVRAADYPPDVSERYVREIRARIAEGLALEKGKGSR